MSLATAYGGDRGCSILGVLVLDAITDSPKANKAKSRATVDRHVGVMVQYAGNKDAGDSRRQTFSTTKEKDTLIELERLFDELPRDETRRSQPIVGNERERKMGAKAVCSLLSVIESPEPCAAVFDSGEGKRSCSKMHIWTDDSRTRLLYIHALYANIHFSPLYDP